MATIGETQRQSLVDPPKQPVQGSCCGRACEWICEHPFLFVINLLLVAGIAATASVDLSLEIKLYACLSGAAVLLLIDGVYYRRNRTVEDPASVDPIPKGDVARPPPLSKGFMAFLKAAGYDREDVVDVVSCHRIFDTLMGGQVKHIYRLDYSYYSDIASRFGEQIYFPNFSIIVEFIPDRNSIQIYKIVEAEYILVASIDSYQMNAPAPTWAVTEFRSLVQGKPNEF